MMRPGLRIALQEWAVCIRALESGSSCVLIRKGGIHEPQGGLFAPEHPRFVLLPSFLHQSSERLRETYQGAFLQAVSVNPQPGIIPVSAYAEVVRVWKCLDLAAIQGLGTELVWSDAEIQSRFSYRQQPWLYVLALRVHRLAELVKLPDRPSYGGCRSWITLEDPVATTESTPAIRDDAFAERMRAIAGKLDTPQERA
jgi:hypothetical protein